MNNMEIYDKVRAVPDKAKRQITAGRLKGKTDINPMWRIKVLTETFGPCGTGWYVQVVDKRIEDGSDGIKVAIVDLNLFYRQENGEWSAPVFGTGGNTLVDKETKGLYTSDEAFKMAYTDALSVCCKMLGVGADVYWEADRTKYGALTEPQKPDNQPPVICKDCGNPIVGVKFKNGTTRTPFDLANDSLKKYGASLCYSCARKRFEAQEKRFAIQAAGETPPWEERA